MNISGTGHRPNKAWGSYQWNTDKFLRIKKIIKNKLIEIIENKLKENKEEKFYFHVGGALGFDQMLFEIAYELKTYYSTKIFIEYCIPFKDQPKTWISKEDINRYFNQIQLSDKVTYVDTLSEYNNGLPIDIYDNKKMQYRNMYMVDKLVNENDILIALWDKSRGGTYNCINYAEKQNKNILYFNPFLL